MPEGELDDVDITRVAQALSAELDLAVRPPYPPLYANRLYNPRSRPRFAISAEHLKRIDLERFDLPVCDRVTRRSVMFHHAALMGDESDVADIATGFRRVLEHSAELRG